MAFLEVKDLHVSYGAIKAIRGISLEVEKGEIVTLIGSNGAGKTTTMNTLAGLIKPADGQIIFKGENIAGHDAPDIVARGITLSPEGRQVFPKLSVWENLNMGAYTVRDSSVRRHGFEQAFDLFPILKERSNQAAGTLSGGEQQMLAVARALMSNPELLMLDEPSLGLAPIIIQNIFQLIKRINSMGTTILLVEQNAKMALGISDRGYVLETGKIVHTDTGENLMKSEEVKNAYLGGI